MKTTNEFPTTDRGDIINNDYWEKIKPSVNKCGVDMWDLFSEYRGVSPFDVSKIEEAAMKLWSLWNKYGEVSFAVNIIVFYENSAPEGSAFTVALHSYYDEMPPSLLETCERLRYLNTKLMDRIKDITKELKMKP